MKRDGGILVVGPAWVGDMVMCQSLFITLRRRHPDARIDVLAPDWTRPLLERMPEVSEALPLQVEHGRLRPLAQWRAVREVRRRGYRQAIVTRRSLKSALVPFLAGVPERTGILGENRHWLINDVRAVNGESHRWAVERLAVLGMEPGAAPGLDGVPWPKLVANAEAGAEAERRLGADGAGSVVGLAPGAAYGPAKRWPQAHWEQLAAALTRSGRRVWVFGAAGERDEGEAIAAAGGPGATSLCGHTSLGEVADLMARCEAVVSNDSGLMHVAAAAGPRVIALFGSTSPANTPPLDPRARVIYRALECSPCYARTCPLGHLRCLTEITVDEVLAHLEEGAQASEELA
ncbi:lipopolysaccharide heptosyltransferase II [Gemmatimonadota bacterium Y43]|uniref:lipopolysaccharide heptosyltransferase II n=1 Tax=Gaopeijia maritima TaxID=3119007 RepID=UPI00328F1D56